MQEAVGGVRGGAAGVVAHADGEDGVLGGGDGHSRAGRHFEDDQAESGGDGVGEPREGGFVAVAAQQFGVVRVAGGQQLGLEAVGDEAGGVGGVGGSDRRLHAVRRFRGPGRGAARLRFDGGRVPLCGGLGVVLAHG